MALKSRFSRKRLGLPAVTVQEEATSG
jgi:hypothetical protein